MIWNGKRCPTWRTKTNTMVVKHLLNGMILQSGWMQKCNSIGCLNWIASLGDVEATNTSKSMLASLEKNHPFVKPGFQAQKKTWSKKCRQKAFPRTPNLSAENIYGTNYISFGEGSLKFLISYLDTPYATFAAGWFFGQK